MLSVKQGPEINKQFFIRRQKAPKQYDINISNKGIKKKN